MTAYLRLATVLAMHREQVEAFGGAHGVRDQGLLEAALARPQSGYYADIIEQAAALWESLAQNHPFVDGNKRVAFDVTDAFLRVNGWRIKADPLATYAFIIERYETGTFRFEALVKWLQDNTERRG